MKKRIIASLKHAGTSTTEDKHIIKKSQKMKIFKIDQI
jgi:hypothetical protein